MSYLYKPEVRAEVWRLTEERDQLHAKMQRRNRFVFEDGGWRWQGTRRARKRWEQAVARWERALDDWRGVALMAYNMMDPPKVPRGPRPKGTNTAGLVAAVDWTAIQAQRRRARLTDRRGS